MNIKQNLGILAQRISRSRNATRTFMMGLNPMPEKVNESSLIQKLVITPPANGRAFIQYLNRKGQVCTGQIEIRDIQTIRDYIKEFTTTENNKDNGKE